MLPVLDLHNHRLGAPVDWEADDERVTFRTRVAVAAGDEIHIDYGAQSNEELLFAFGIAQVDNPHDTYGVQFTAEPAGEEEGWDEEEAEEEDGVDRSQAVSVGPFRLRRASSPAGQFPQALWDALEDPWAYLASTKGAGGGGGAWGDGEPEPRSGLAEVDGDDATTLRAMLRSRLAPFSATRAADLERALSSELGGLGEAAVREVHVARYRCGQFDVITDAIATLDEMLDGTT